MPHTASYRLLLVEDNPGDVDLICEELAKLPGRFEVECVTRLERAFALLDGGDVDAVVLDLNLPDSTGIETLRRLRAAHPDVAVIATSGTNYGDLRDAALAHGALDFVSKVDPPAALIARSALYVIERGRVRDQQGQVERLVADNPDAVVVVDRAGFVRYANAAALALFGRDEADFLGDALGLPVAAGAPAVVDVPGRGRKAEMRVSQCQWGGRPAFLATLRDVTERDALAAQLQQARKMEAVGLLAGGVAHDFNNLLTVINGYAAFGLNAVRDGDPLAEFLREIVRAGERAAALTRQLLAFSRKQVMQPRVLDLNRVIGSTEKMLQRLIGEDIALETRLADALWPVVADPGQIEQVVMNLAVNARDAMPLGGRLAFATENVVLDESFVQTHVEAQAGPHVLVAVSDTGCGMSPAVVEHIFEPFFTTKEQGKGTGLGLATVHGIVHQSGGSVWVESEEGEGTTFRIYLPAAREEDLAAAEAVRRSAASTMRGSETVLLVEDEATLRQLTRRILEQSGYTVVAAANGAEALETCARYPGTIDLLLTDVIMPGMSGPDLVAKIGAVRPGLRVLYMSGYSGDAVARHGVIESGTNFIEKPFTPPILLDRVRRALDATKG